MGVNTIPIRAKRLIPFASSLDHVLAEIGWVESLVRVPLDPLREAPKAPDAYKGLVITDQEIEDLLGRAPGMLPFASRQNMSDESHATELRRTIDARCELSLQEGIPLRISTLQKAFGLSAFDLKCLLLCLAPAVDLRFERFYAYLQDDVTRRLPCVDLVLNLLCNSWQEALETRERFSPRSPLRRFALIQLVDEPSRPGELLLSRSLRLDERIADFLLGSDEIDARLRDFALCETASEATDGMPVNSETEVERDAIAAYVSASSCTVVVYVWGAAGSGRSGRALAICRALGYPMLRVRIERMLGSSGGLPGLALVLREAHLRDAAIYFDGFDLLLADDKAVIREQLLRAIEGFGPCVFLSGSECWHPAAEMEACEFLSLECKPLDHAERIALWTAHLHSAIAPQLDLSELASKFRFNAGQIAAAAKTAGQIARSRSPQHAAIGVGDVYGACRIQARGHLGKLGRRVDPRHTWADIVLPDDRARHLREICNCVKYRPVVFEQWGFDRKLSLGKGLNMLFAGPSGTGKTMAAEIMGAEVGLDVYKIDLSSIVSKYIGETEKNLARIFAEAELSNAILFFDEADSLFGKRTEVRDSHDRYANIEVNYLLQKMEEHEGVVILATNFRKNMDDAFVRRLHFTVDFPVPCEADRRRIWQKIWPSETPLASDVDLDFMARRFEFPGGNIRNVALAAAFLAAADGGVVTLAHLLYGTRREYQKMGKVVHHSEFGYDSSALERASVGLGDILTT
jgi:hypothetical protein